MSDHTHSNDDLVERVAANIAGQRLDAETERRITALVWEGLGASPAPLRDCADFQREIPQLVAGTLPPARALLVGDHSGHCVACRRALMEARGELRPAAVPAAAVGGRRWQRAALRTAAAALLVVGGAAGLRLAGDLAADRRLRASVASIDGVLQLVGADGGPLAEGHELRSHQSLRTARGAGAFIRLGDGSLVEMNERTEIALRASRRGTTVELTRGAVLVHAAEQHGGRLFVATADCEVAVKGTIFSVNHGLKGSRVSVLEGEVEVRGPTARTQLLPGDQLTTNDRLRRVALEDEVAWSRDAASHRELLRELAALHQAVAKAIDDDPPRTSTRLLDLAPADTLVYAAIPNLADGLGAARAALEERLAASPALRDWWQARMAATGAEAELDALLARLQPLGDALGAEAVVVLPAGVLVDRGGPLFLAELDDPEAFRAGIGELLAEGEASCPDGGCVLLVEDPGAAVPPGAQLLLWVAGDVVVAATDAAGLTAAAARLADPAARGFLGTRLHRRLGDAYAGGVSWLVGVDVGRLVAEAAAELEAGGARALQESGLADATTLLVERHRDGDWYATDAELQFAGARRGMASWLAAPAPMGSLEFISPQAAVAAAAVTRDPVEMFDELLALVAAEDDSALAELERLQDRLGIDLRNELAATFGGEAAFALDGPMLPVPSWKLVVEVYDPATLAHTLERAVTELNLVLTEHGEAPVVLEVETVGDRSYTSLGREGLAARVTFTVVDGYLVAGPGRAVVDQAIAQRDSGVSLPGAEAFRAMLPDNGFADCSALVYRNLGALASAVPEELLRSYGFAGSLEDGGLGRGLVCVFAATDRLSLSATGGGLPLVSSLLALVSAEEAGAVAAAPTSAVSSAG